MYWVIFDAMSFDAQALCQGLRIYDDKRATMNLATLLNDETFY